MKYLVGALIGAIIGYITNWLAIKMLFRPYEEKRFLGIKIPFTPGLIPKEKNRIARSVGETIGEHLLTTDSLTKALCSKEMNESLNSWIKNKAYEITNSEKSLEENLRDVLGKEYDNIMDFTQEEVTNSLIENLRKDETKDYFEKIIGSQLKVYLSKDLNSIFNNNNYDVVKYNICEKLIKYKSSDEFSQRFYEFIRSKLNDLEKSGQSLKEILPSGVMLSVKEYLYNNKEGIATRIKQELKEDNWQYKIKNLLSQILKEKLNPMIAMFINVEIIYEKVMPVMYSLLDKDENQAEIIKFLEKAIDDFTEKELKDIVSNISEETIEKNLKEISRNIINKLLSDEGINAFIEGLEKELIDQNLTLEQLLNNLQIPIEGILTENISLWINNYIGSQQFQIKIKDFNSKILNKFMNLTPKQLIKNKESIINILSKSTEVIYNKFIGNTASKVIDKLNIESIVEDKINEFPVDFAEEIILKIAKKELSAITWLGGLLGGIIGILSPIISSLHF